MQSNVHLSIFFNLFCCPFVVHAVWWYVSVLEDLIFFFSPFLGLFAPNQAENILCQVLITRNLRDCLRILDFCDIVDVNAMQSYNCLTFFKI